MGTTSPISRWNNWAARYIIQKGQIIQSAQFKVFITTNEANVPDDHGGTVPNTATLLAGEIRGINNGGPDNWSETGGPQPTPAGILDIQPLPTGGAWVTFDVTDFIRQKASENGLATFMVWTGNQDYGATINNRSNPVNPPELIVTTGSHIECTDNLASQSGWSGGVPVAMGTTSPVSQYNRLALQFSVTPGTTFQTAKLRVYRENPAAVPVNATIWEAVTSGWTETAGPQPTRGTLIQSIAVPSGGVWMEFDVTDYVQSHLNNGIVSFLLATDQDAWNTSVDTRQGANPPQLILQSTECTDNLSAQGDWSGGIPLTVPPTEALSQYNRMALQFRITPNASFQTAKLRVYRENPGAVPVNAELFEAITSGWTETAGPQPARGTLIQSIAVPDGGLWMEFDVTSYVRSNMSAGKVTFVLETDQGAWNMVIDTRHGARPPQLVLE
jgi:hypothetical protein